MSEKFDNTIEKGWQPPIQRKESDSGLTLSLEPSPEVEGGEKFPVEGRMLLGLEGWRKSD